MRPPTTASAPPASAGTDSARRFVYARCRHAGRRFLAATATLAGASILDTPSSAPRAQTGFNWRRYASTKLRVLTLKFPLSEIQ
jgi:hypothetical protein